VLPGAFSAYRYRALLAPPETPNEGPLVSYFKGEKPSADSGIFDANMYLAEDRILCFELVAKRNYAWTLRYVKSAWAETDVPDTVPELIGQRRRWLNGTFFVALFSVVNFPKIYTTDHARWRKVLFHLQLMYNVLSILFSWFALVCRKALIVIGRLSSTTRKDLHSSTYMCVPSPSLGQHLSYVLYPGQLTRTPR
jgi:chitin synthase